MMPGILTAGQVDALIAAGGCLHTVDPFKACDTCGRAAVAAPSRAVTGFDFRAETVDGQVFDKRDVLSVMNLPLDKVCRIRVKTDDLRFPKITLGCDPRKGERLRVFTRHAVRSSVNGGSATERISVLIIEVWRPIDDSFVRLYLHPQQGPILTTEDLYF